MCFGIRISSPFDLNTLNIPIQNIKCPKNTKNHFLPSHYLWSLNCVVFAQACQTQSVWPAMLSMNHLFGAMLCAGICDQRWKWLQSFVISSSKHEMCSHVFHLSSLYHFRAQSQWLKGDGRSGSLLAHSVGSLCHEKLGPYLVLISRIGRSDWKRDPGT